ncbi:MAG: acetate--CoA ligase family protein [Candidatus Aenigmarchaeota archaeon]|nr:acetate--CoA ligase family protein [Candidatus Aenigmarchaeota archaeon]MDI6722770.1 acetate--CoA ligase family protein [Candidatus Aenigmarchaeota archaeon]
MNVWTEKRAEDFLSKRIPVAKSILARSILQAEKFAKKYPVVLKIVSKQAIHKSDIGGVKIARNEIELKKYFAELIKISKKKRIRADILVQEFVDGKELVVGINKDPVFGHVIMFGIGGKYVEVIRDVSFRICPITQKDAESMIQELKYKQLLYGARNEKPVNINDIKKIAVKVSKIPQRYRKLKELDINPLIANEKKAVVADARMVWE